MKPYETEFRLSRPTAYGPGTPGHTDPGARQGYYFQTETKEQAISKMAQSFPNERFDVQVWKESKMTRMEKALKVIILSPRINEWLAANDPKALEQCGAALWPEIVKLDPAIAELHKTTLS